MQIFEYGNVTKEKGVRKTVLLFHNLPLLQYTLNVITNLTSQHITVTIYPLVTD